MELKQGFRQTEIGIIPEDWEMKDIASISSIFGGGTPSTAIGDYWNGEIPWVSAGDVSNTKGRFITDTSYKITELGLSSCSTRIMPEGTTIIIARGATVGRIAQFGQCMAFNQTCYALLPFGQVDRDFLFYSMKYSVNEIIKGLASGTIFGTVTTSSFSQWKIPVPSKIIEQQAIAAALSDVDSLIASLNSLIAKKRAIRQGMMQDLLTGKRRLPGFKNEWGKYRLDEVVDKKKNYSFVGGPFGSNLKASEYTPNGVRIIQLQNIGDGVFNNDYAIFTSDQKADELIACNIYPGEIILSKMGDPVARACLMPMNDKRYLMASDGIRLAVDEKRFDKIFILYFINSAFFRNNAIEASTGSTRQRISLKVLKSLPVFAPPLMEQKEIANILHDIDAEIRSLEQKREKTRLIKLGMMQELLTGRTRLVS